MCKTLKKLRTKTSFLSKKKKTFHVRYRKKRVSAIYFRTNSIAIQSPQDNTVQTREKNQRTRIKCILLYHSQRLMIFCKQLLKKKNFFFQSNRN